MPREREEILRRLEGRLSTGSAGDSGRVGTGRTPGVAAS